MAADYELLIYDEILPDDFQFGVRPSLVKDALNSMEDGSHVLVRINSPGGSVFDGFAIHNLIKSAAKRLKIESVIDGIAASAASYVALAADTVTAFPESAMMIHNVQSVVWGDAKMLRSEADKIEKYTRSIADIYERKSGTPSDEWVTRMDEETWYTGKEALVAGLVDVVDEHGEAKTKNTAGRIVKIEMPARLL